MDVADASLAQWLRDRGVAGTPASELRTIGGGRSNRTDLLELTDGTSVVIRRPPAGHRLATAHDVIREARIIAAVRAGGIPVPAVRAVDTEGSGPFDGPVVVYEHVVGIALTSSAAASMLGAEARRSAAFGLADALAALHSLDPAAIGLGDLQRPGRHSERLLRRWSQQYAAAGGEDRRVLHAHAWLAANQPSAEGTALLHGDPKLDNTLVAADGRLLALVDWELSAVGDPLADVGMLLAYWSEPDDEVVVLQDPVTAAGGFPTRAELLDRYMTAAGRDVDDESVGFHLALARWRITCIVQGVLDRARSAPDSDAALVDRFERQVDRLARLTEQSVDVAGDPHLSPRR